MMPTAREFYDEHYSIDAVVMMRDFAKLHVEAALKEVMKIDFEEVPYIKEANTYEEAKEITILNAYPIENIK